MAQKIKGTYALLIFVESDCDIVVGALGKRHFVAGWYVYVGSAQNGLFQRISRHLGTSKKKHWHVDYLLEQSRVEEVWIFQSEESVECLSADQLKERFDCIKGFGCSDCSCASHLFYGEKNDFQLFLGQLDFEQFSIDKFMSRFCVLEVR